MPIHIFETQSFLPNLLDSFYHTPNCWRDMFMTTLCLSSASLQAASHYSNFSPELLPNSLAHRPAHPSDSPAHKQLSPKDATRNVQLSQPKSR